VVASLRLPVRTMNAVRTSLLTGEQGDAYMSALHWLSTNAALSGRILAPIKALSGAYKSETKDKVYVLFPFVTGSMPGIQCMTKKQTMKLAETLAILHTVSVFMKDADFWLMVQRK